MKAYKKPEFECVQFTSAEELMSVPDTSYGDGIPPMKTADNRDNDR